MIGSSGVKYLSKARTATKEKINIVIITMDVNLSLNDFLSNFNIPARKSNKKGTPK